MYVNPYSTESLFDMARKTKQESLETRQQILIAAGNVFSQNGVSNTSLNDIAEAAGVSRGAIYWHFKNKVELFNELWDEVESNIDGIEQYYFDEYIDSPITALRSLLIYILQITASDSKQRTLMEILFHKCEFVGEMIGVLKSRKSLHMTGYDRIENTLARCIECHQLPDNLNKRLSAIMMRSCISGVLENWLASPESFDLYNEASNIVDGFLEMLKLSKHLRID